MTTHKTEMTIGAFLEMADTYPYSKEHFETMKTIGELTLMEIYREASEYLSENTDISTELRGTFITESGDGIKDFRDCWTQRIL